MSVTQTSGLSNALSVFNTANPATPGTADAAQTQQLAALSPTGAGAENSVQVLTDALKHHHAGQVLQGAADALTNTRREQSGHSASSWFSDPTANPARGQVCHSDTLTTVSLQYGRACVRMTDLTPRVVIGRAEAVLHSCS